MTPTWQAVGIAVLIFLPLVAFFSWASFRAGYDAGRRSRFPDLDEEVEK